MLAGHRKRGRPHADVCDASGDRPLVGPGAKSFLAAVRALPTECKAENPCGHRRPQPPTQAARRGVRRGRGDGRSKVTHFGIPQLPSLSWCGSDWSSRVRLTCGGVREALRRRPAGASATHSPLRESRASGPARCGTELAATSRAPFSAEPTGDRGGLCASGRAGWLRIFGDGAGSAAIAGPVGSVLADGCHGPAQLFAMAVKALLNALRLPAMSPTGIVGRSCVT
jgi:hypothetical protein